MLGPGPGHRTKGWAPYNTALFSLLFKTFFFHKVKFRVPIAITWQEKLKTD